MENDPAALAITWRYSPPQDSCYEEELKVTHGDVPEKRNPKDDLGGNGKPFFLRYAEL